MAGLLVVQVPDSEQMATRECVGKGSLKEDVAIRGKRGTSFLQFISTFHNHVTVPVGVEMQEITRELGPGRSARNAKGLRRESRQGLEHHPILPPARLGAIEANVARAARTGMVCGAC